MTTTTRAVAIAAALAATTLITGAAFAETVAYKAELKGASEVPATPSAGGGTAVMSYDTATKKLTWNVNYTGLTGAITAAHFHSPAMPTENAAVSIPLTGTASPGEATLTDAQAADLAAGKMYLNLHTAMYPNGEIRGQVTKAN